MPVLRQADPRHGSALELPFTSRDKRSCQIVRVSAKAGFGLRCSLFKSTLAQSGECRYTGFGDSRLTLRAGMQCAQSRNRNANTGERLWTVESIDWVPLFGASPMDWTF